MEVSRSTDKINYKLSNYLLVKSFLFYFCFSYNNLLRLFCCQTKTGQLFNKISHKEYNLTELLCMVEMMWQPKNHEISNPAPGVFPKLSWVVWTHFWWFRVHIWAQNWAQTRKIRKYLKIRPNEMWWKKCLLIIKNAWDFGYLRDFPREFEWRIENWHFWKFFLVKLVQLFWAL